MTMAVRLILAGLACALAGTAKAGRVNKVVLATKEAPGAIGPYSQGIKVASPGGAAVYVSGQVGLYPNGTAVEGGIVPETEQLMKNIEAILAAGGLTMDDVVECTCLLADLDEYDAFNAVYAKFFDSDSPPARAAFGGNVLPKQRRAEVKCSAHSFD